MQYHTALTLCLQPKITIFILRSGLAYFGFYLLILVLFYFDTFDESLDVFLKQHSAILLHLKII